MTSSVFRHGSCDSCQKIVFFQNLHFLIFFWVCHLLFGRAGYCHFSYDLIAFLVCRTSSMSCSAPKFISLFMIYLWETGCVAACWILLNYLLYKRYKIGSIAQDKELVLQRPRYYRWNIHGIVYGCIGQHFFKSVKKQKTLYRSFLYSFLVIFNNSDQLLTNFCQFRQFRQFPSFSVIFRQIPSFSVKFRPK